MFSVSARRWFLVSMLSSNPNFLWQSGAEDNLDLTLPPGEEKHLQEGDSAQISCPSQGSPLDRVEWSRAGDLLAVDRWLHLGARSRVRVDEHGFLLIEDADQEVQGQFSCRSGSTLSRLSVSVTPRPILSSPEFRTSLETIIVVLLVCTMIYVFCVCVMWLQPREMVRPKIEDAIHEDDAERRHLQPWLDALEPDSSDYEADSEEDDHDCRHETFVSVQIHKEDHSPGGESAL